MRLILFLLVTCCSVCARSGESYAIDDHTKKLVRAYIERSSSERQFISYLKNWIFGRGEDKQVTKTKIKYLPIYVPVPVYSDTKIPTSSDFYGAHPQKPKPEETEMMLQVPPRPSLPYPHTQRYELPYGGQLNPMSNRQSPPFYYMPYGEQYTRPAQVDISSSYYNPLPGSGEYTYEYSFEDSGEAGSFSDQETNDYDSVVVDNPELITDSNQNQNENQNQNQNQNGDEFLRKRKKYKKKKN